MIRLSVNVNKVATLRNSRGGNSPNLCEAVEVCLRAGAPGITVHPRADARHITRDDVLDVARLLQPHREHVELNIEGDPREDWLELVLQTRPHQATLVPVRPGEVTSEAGWDPDAPVEPMQRIVTKLQAQSIRVSIFVEARRAPIAWAKASGADRIELYTEPFARAFEEGPEAAQACFARFVDAAHYGHELGMGINAGHDLDLDNLPLFRTLPHLDEVSIGHALISRALYVGLDRAVREYLERIS